MGHHHHQHRKIKQHPPQKRRHLLFLILSAPLLLLLSIHLSAAALRRANALGRRCSPPDPREYSGDERGRLRIAMVSFSEEEGRDEAVRRRRSFKGVMELVGGNKRSYADEMGYDFVDARRMVDPSRPPNWSKILAVRSYLDRYDWVFWNDADTLMTNPDISLESILKAAIGHLNFHASQDLVVTEDINGVNSGVFFVRRSKWSKDFLDKWWNQTSFIQFGSTKSGDNAAMKHLIDGLSPEELRVHVRMSPMQCLFNSYPFNPTWKSAYRLISSPQTIWRGAYSKGDFMVHLAGFDNKREWAAKILQELKAEQRLYVVN